MHPKWTTLHSKKHAATQFVIILTLYTEQPTATIVHLGEILRA